MAPLINTLMDYPEYTRESLAYLLKIDKNIRKKHLFIYAIYVIRNKATQIYN